MSITLNIHHDTCICCGKCTKVCLSLILTQQKSDGKIAIEHPETCISCGHCVAVCPTASVQHNFFPPEKVHPIDRHALPSPEQVMLLCRARRSNRAMTDKPVPAEYLTQIIEAAHRAPTASNRQQVAFTLITDPAKLQLISRFTIDTFLSIARKLENPLLRPLLRRLMPDAYNYLPAFRRMEQELARGRDMILRGATSVVFIHTPKENAFGVIDANLAYQNGSLMAESLGVSQVWTGFVYMAIQRDKRGTLAKALGIDGTIHAGMALGMPQFLFPNYIDKKPVNTQE